MSSTDTTAQQISLFADGELEQQQHAHALAALREPAAGATWDVYHQIGDLLRSSDMAVPMRADFGARMAARLAAEPAYLGADLAPRVEHAAAAAAGHAQGNKRRWLVPGAAMAATLVLMLTALPRLTALHESGAATAQSAAAGAVQSNLTNVSATTLRDARIDEYLQAHKRFSPSLYSTAQYDARSATFATESDKE